MARTNRHIEESTFWREADMAGKPTSRKKRLTIAEQRQQLADAGDVEGIWQIIITANPIMVDWEELFQLLLRAMIIRSRTEPERFSAELLARMFALTSFLTLRAFGKHESKSPPT